MAREPSNGPMEQNIMDFGRITKCTGMVSSSGLMDVYTLENMQMTRNTDKEFTPGLMVDTMTAGFIMENNTVKAFTNRLMAKMSMASGSKERSQRFVKPISNTNHLWTKYDSIHSQLLLS
jgi:hypothetical protein